MRSPSSTTWCGGGYDREMGVDSLVPIASLEDRVTRWEQVSGHAIDVRIGNLTDAAFTYSVVAESKPDAIVHFGEQRSRRTP